MQNPAMNPTVLTSSFGVDRSAMQLQIADLKTTLARTILEKHGDIGFRNKMLETEDLGISDYLGDEKVLFTDENRLKLANVKEVDELVAFLYQEFNLFRGPGEIDNVWVAQKIEYFKQKENNGELEEIYLKQKINVKSNPPIQFKKYNKGNVEINQMDVALFDSGQTYDINDYLD